MPDPDVEIGGTPASSGGDEPDGANAGAALPGPESNPAGVEEAEAEVIEQARENAASGPENSGPSPWISVVQDLLRAGGKELFDSVKDYLKGDLNLFTRSNPSSEGSPGEGSPGEEARKNLPEVPEEGYFDVQTQDVSPQAPRRSGAEEHGHSPEDQKTWPVESNPKSPIDLTPGDLARVEVSNKVVWVRVAGTARGVDDYEGRLASRAFGMAEGDAVSFAQRQVVGRVEEAPEDPVAEPPESLQGQRTRGQSGRSDGGPLEPRFR